MRLFQVKKVEAGKKALWLRALAEYLASIPNTNWSNSSSSESLFWPQQALHTCAYTHTPTGRTFIQTLSCNWEELLIFSSQYLLFQKLLLSEFIFPFLLKTKSHHKRVFTGFCITAARARYVRTWSGAKIAHSFVCKRMHTHSPHRPSLLLQVELCDHFVFSLSLT